MAYFFLSLQNSSKTKQTPTEPVYADTLIPKGQVLIPIDLANIETLAALINGYAVIDLYGGSTEQSKATQIATRVKILRAPLNPKQYALLVPEEMSRALMQFTPPFWGVLLNHSQQEPPKLTAVSQQPTTGTDRQSPTTVSVSPTPPTPRAVRSPIVKVEYYQGGQ